MEISQPQISGIVPLNQPTEQPVVDPAMVEPPKDHIPAPIDQSVHHGTVFSSPEVKHVLGVKRKAKEPTSITGNLEGYSKSQLVFILSGLCKTLVDADKEINLPAAAHPLAHPERQKKDNLVDLVRELRTMCQNKSIDIKSLTLDILELRAMEYERPSAEVTGKRIRKQVPIPDGLRASDEISDLDSSDEEEEEEESESEEESDYAPDSDDE